MKVEVAVGIAILDRMDVQKSSVWLFDGLPEHLGLSVRDATPLEGGYVVVMQLVNGDVRLFATRFPGKSVADWKSRIRRYGGAELKRVLVSIPHVRYERVKKLLIEKLAEEWEGEGGCSEIDFLKSKAVELFAVKVAAQPAQLTFHGLGSQGCRT